MRSIPATAAASLCVAAALLGFFCCYFAVARPASRAHAEAAEASARQLDESERALRAAGGTIATLERELRQERDWKNGLAAEAERNRPTTTAPARAYLDGQAEDGVIEVPTINLWREPGKLLADGRSLTGTARHGTAVDLLDSRGIDGITFYFVAVAEGANRGLKGWVSERLIRR